MKFYWLLGSAAFLLSSYATIQTNSEPVAQEVEIYEGYNDDQAVYEEYEDDGLIWNGPGLYGGFWFDTEVEFNDWHNYHHHDRGNCPPG
jgi:hypothetical protein